MKILRLPYDPLELKIVLCEQDVITTSGQGETFAGPDEQEDFFS